MDPKATLLAAVEAFEDGDGAGCSRMLACYAGWRHEGGFEPTMPDGTPGDSYATQLRIIKAGWHSV